MRVFHYVQRNLEPVPQGLSGQVDAVDADVTEGVRAHVAPLQDDLLWAVYGEPMGTDGSEWEGEE
jgi:hypothetical protein